MTHATVEPDNPLERGRKVGEYIRMAREEIPPAPGSSLPSEFRGMLPVENHQRGAGGGLLTGGLLTAIDSIGGMLCGLAVVPQWIVTTSLMLRVARLNHGGPLELHASVQRQGRTSVVGVISAVDQGDHGAPVASAIMTCAVLDPGDMVLRFDRPVHMPLPTSVVDRRTPEEFFCIAPGSGLITTMELSDHLRNPWGILHGGAVATLADVAATRAAAVDGSESLAAGDMTLHYLRPVRTGPVEARCEVVGTERNRTLVRVTIHDMGASQRQVAMGSVSVWHW